MYASVNYSHRTSIECGVRVEAENVLTGVVRHTNSCYLTFVAIDGNGRPVPVQNADYQKFTHDLINFTDELWKAVQTRKQETVSDLSEKLNETCANCHVLYRDVSTGTASEGSMVADRCNPMPKAGGRAQ